MNKYFIYFIKLIISVSFVYYLLKKVPFNSIKELFLNIDLLFLFLGVFIFIFCWMVNSKKWGILLNHLGFREKTKKLFKLNLISIFYASILPGGQLTGETIKCYKITKNSKEKGKLVFSVLMDRLTGLIAIIFLGLFGVFFTDSNFVNIDKIKLFFIIGFLSSIFLLLFYVKVVVVKIKNIFNFYHGRFRVILDKIINLFFVYEGAYKVLLNSLLYSLLFQVLNTLSVYFLALSMGINLSIYDLFWVNALVSIVLVIPITIMGLGLREGSFVFLLGLLGITNSLALGLSLLISLVYLATGLIGGIIELYEFFKIKNKAS